MKIPAWCPLFVAVLALALLSACKSDVERAQAFCLERRELLNGLYAAYGGGDFALAAEAEADKATAGKQEGAELVKGLAGVVGDLDRVSFEQDCERIGSGQATAFVTPRPRAFFARPEPQKACAQVVALSRKAAALNASLPDDVRVECQ